LEEKICKEECEKGVDIKKNMICMRKIKFKMVKINAISRGGILFWAYREPPEEEKDFST
jgi:hypothetical protein